jgi:hypothetical protein
MENTRIIRIIMSRKMRLADNVALSWGEEEYIKDIGWKATTREIKV